MEQYSSNFGCSQLPPGSLQEIIRKPSSALFLCSPRSHRGHKCAYVFRCQLVDTHPFTSVRRVVSDAGGHRDMRMKTTAASMLGMRVQTQQVVVESRRIRPSCPAVGALRTSRACFSAGLKFGRGEDRHGEQSGVFKVQFGTRGLCVVGAASMSSNPPQVGPKPPRTRIMIIPIIARTNTSRQEQHETL